MIYREKCVINPAILIF